MIESTRTNISPRRGWVPAGCRDSMNPDLALVRELQLVDGRMRELTEEIARLPKYVAEIESKLESHKKALAEDQAALEENRKSRRLMDGEITTWQQKMSPPAGPDGRGEDQRAVSGVSEGD